MLWCWHCEKPPISLVEPRNLQTPCAVAATASSVGMKCMESRTNASWLMPANTSACLNQNPQYLKSSNSTAILKIMPNEVEIKFQIADRKALEEKLRSAGFREKTPSTHEMNTLYDFPGLALRKKGELLRI